VPPRSLRDEHGEYTIAKLQPRCTSADYASWLLLLLAGQAAESALGLPERDARDRGDGADRYRVAQLVAAASARFPDLAAPAAADAWVAGLEALAGRLVRAYWPAIEAVAAALLREGRLEGAAAVDLIEAAVPGATSDEVDEWSGATPDEVAGWPGATPDDVSEARHACRLYELEGVEREYRRILAGELRRVTLTLDEAVLLLEVWGRPFRTPGESPFVAFRVADALEFEPPGERRTAGAALIEKLRALSPGEEAAVVDALERVHRMPWNLPLDLLLHKIGLGR